MADLHAAAKRNIVLSLDFVDAKITSIAIVEALAQCTETGGPIAMFLGDIRSACERPKEVENYLPTVPATGDVNSELLRVFEKGCTLESTNNLTVSPITAFVYRHMGHQGTQRALAEARMMFDVGGRMPLNLLQTLDCNMVCAIIRVCAHLARSRRVVRHLLAQAL